MNKLEGFGPLYIINIPDQTRRLNMVKSQIKEYEIKDYEIIKAIDGRSSNLSELVSGEYPKLKPQEIGCIASHVKTIKHWIETSDSEYAIIMEDDCSFDLVKYWQWDWKYFIENIPKDADIIQLAVIKNNHVVYSMHKKEPYKNTSVGNYGWSTACYLIKRSYGKKILKSFTVEDKLFFSDIKLKNKAADVILYSLGNAYCMPILSYFLSNKDSINNNHHNFHKKSKENIESWWKYNSDSYTVESFFDVKNGLVKKNIKKNGIAFNIFHVDGTTDTARKRTILTDRATKQLLPNFDRIDTPTIIIQNFDDVKNFYSQNNIKIDPKGHKGAGWKFGELGVWASNYTAWKNFADSEYQMLILMEDDITLNKDFNNKLSGYIQELPDNWDFFTVFIPSFGNIRYDSSRKNLEIGSNNICKVYQSWSCLCYVISKRGARRLLKQASVAVSSPIDHWLFYHPDLNGYAIKMERGNICDIYKTSSTIQSSKRYDMTGYV